MSSRAVLPSRVLKREKLGNERVSPKEFAKLSHYRKKKKRAQANTGFLKQRQQIKKMKKTQDEMVLETSVHQNLRDNNLSWFGIVQLVMRTIAEFFHERPGQIIGSAFILLMLWGYHGNLELLGLVWKDWVGPGSNLAPRPQLIPGIPWDHELISFWGGAFLLVMIPILIIKLKFKQPLAHYGLALPPKGKRALAASAFAVLVLTSLPAFWLGTQDAGMRAVYPFYKNFSSTGEFLFYELSYLPFFLAIEFIFRGYLLFGLAGVRDEETDDNGYPGEFYFSKYALLIQMLSYTAWHLGKPLPELWGTLIWGMAAGAIAYAVRSIWPVVFAHWILNVFLDAVIIKLI